MIQPAIDLASEGFLMPEDLARQFESRIRVDFPPIRLRWECSLNSGARIRREICLFSLIIPDFVHIKQLARRDFTTGKPPSR